MCGKRGAKSSCGWRRQGNGGGDGTTPRHQASRLPVSFSACIDAFGANSEVRNFRIMHTSRLAAFELISISWSSGIHRSWISKFPCRPRLGTRALLLWGQMLWTAGNTALDNLKGQNPHFGRKREVRVVLAFFFSFFFQPIFLF